ncbi:MAG TPA: flagellar filament capping protein FliD [Bryobacteraceae bacterium]|jgi:flagellar hook-associated protein 2
MSAVSNPLTTILDPITVAGSNSSSNSTSNGSTGSSSGTFTGASEYSEDLQNVISRAVAIAELPITQLTNQESALQSQSSALSSIDSDLGALQTAIQGVDSAMSGSYQADVSNPAVVSASTGAGVVAGSYSIEVDSVGAYASSLSTANWTGTTTDPGGTYSLVIGDNTYSIQSTDGSASSVAAAINSQYGSQVQATVVNVGSAGSPDQRISLQATTLGAETLDIQDSSGDSLQSQGPAGSLASYIVDGSGNTVSSDSRTATIATGLTVNLLSSDRGNPATITVSGNDYALSSALSSFTSAYNKVATDLDNQRGQSAGPLQGQSILSEINQAIDNVATYFSSSTSGVNGLKELGLDLGETGQLTFDSQTLDSAYASNPAGVASFLGSATGGGWLESATNALTGLVDPTVGLVTNEETNLGNQITSISKQITTKQDQVTTMQTNLTNQMAAADAMIATMEQQQSFLTQMMQAEQIDSQAIMNE